jgi:hypothetical protein
MDYKISFQESAAIAMIHLSKQLPTFFRTSQKTSALFKGKHQNKAEEIKRSIIFAK